MRLSIFAGDITDAPAEAVCTSTNPRLSLMMGTGAAVRARGGFAILRECERHAPLPPGSAVATTAGALPHKIAIHCVASDDSHRSSEAIVRACVTNALGCADAAGCVSIAMPLFGTGHPRLRVTDVARAMARAALAAETKVRDMTFVTDDEARVDGLRAVLQEITGGPIDVAHSTATEPEVASFWDAE